MANPWDTFPFPAAADDDMRKTYYGVGLVMTCWESVEFELARLFSSMVRDPDGFSLRLYGSARIFRDRIDYLSRTADAHFIRCPDQHTEGEFQNIVAACHGFSARRNEVAHGIVMNVANIAFFRTKIPILDQSKVQALLVPPFHLLRSHDSNGFPLFAYNCSQLEQLALNLHEIEKAVSRLRSMI